MVLRSFIERKNVVLSWVLVMMNHFWVILAISMNEPIQLNQTVLYLGGIIVSGIIGLICLHRIKQVNKQVDLDMFYGVSVPYPVLAFVFLMACLGLAGFPITPTFIGEDLIFSHIREDQFVLALIASLSFIIHGLAIIRIYARIFMGPYNSVYSKSV